MQTITRGEVIERPIRTGEDGDIEPIDDPAEIAAMVRRVVTLTWRDAVFTYDELADHLMMNGAVLPENIQERDDYFEQIIIDIWHTRKALARAAGEALPSLVRVEQHGVDMIGVATSRIPDTIADEPVVQQQEVVVSPEVPLDERVRMASITLGAFINDGYKGRPMRRRDLVELLGGADEIDYKVFGQMLQALMSNGYLAAERQGGERNAPIWYKVPEGVTEELTEQADEGSLSAAIDYIFRDAE